MDGSTGVWILGGYQSDVARNLTKEGRDFAALTDEVVDGAKTFGTLNFGGSTATTISFVVSTTEGS